MIRTRALLAILPFCALPAAAASVTAAGTGTLSAGASIDLRIVVPRALEMRMLDQPRTIEVTASDAASGEVVVSGPRVALVSNVRRGYWIDAVLRRPFTEALIEGLRAPLRVGPSGGRALMPSTAGEHPPATFPLRLRLRLEKGTPPGTYPWPVALSIQAP